MELKVLTASIGGIMVGYGLSPINSKEGLIGFLGLIILVVSLI